MTTPQSDSDPSSARSRRPHTLTPAIVIAALGAIAFGTTPGDAQVCPGDCDLDRRVTIYELQKAVSISLGRSQPAECKALDLNQNGRADIDELVMAVAAAAGECGSSVEVVFDCPWPDIPDDDIHTFLMAGQSNMRGTGRPEDLAENLFLGDPRVENFGDRWTTLQPAPTFFGPELGFAHTIAKACPNSRIGVVKVFRANSGINSWLRDWDEELANASGPPDIGPLYPPMLERALSAARSAVVSWEGFVWVHGQNDKRSLELAEQYGENMALLIDAVRDDLRDPELPFIFQHSLRSAPEALANLFANLIHIPVGQLTVETEKWRAQFEISDSYAADWSLLGRSDTVHLSSQGYVIGGRLLAEAFLPSRRPNP